MRIPDLIHFAVSSGRAFAEVAGVETVAGRVVHGPGPDEFRSSLVGMLELDAYLDDQAISAT